MRVWYVPTDRGDIRLEPADGGSILEITSPSTSERATLDRFVTTCRERGWLKEVSPYGSETRTQRIVLAQSVVELGPILAQAAFQDDATWTATRSKTGAIKLVSEPAEVPKETVAAATFRPPARGCPAPEPANERASDVLRTFCSAGQWFEWERSRSLLAYGSRSGQPYRIYHRGEAHRRGLAYIVVAPTGTEVCVWQGTVPAEEEVLAAKLAIEHRESWVRARDPG